MDFAETEVVFSARDNEMDALGDECSEKTESVKVKFSQQF